jgi:DNA-binding beta-propeller fold protein YncE
MKVKTHFLSGMLALGATFGSARQAHGDFLYWTDLNAFNPGSDIRRANTDGTGQTTILPGNQNRLQVPNGLAIDAAAGKLYWTQGDPNADTGLIIRANLNGSGQQTLVPSAFFPVSIALDPSGGKMYWIQHAQPTAPSGEDIDRANLDGSGAVNLVHMPVQIGNGSLALDLAGGKIYFTDYNDGLIERCNLDGTAPTTLISGLNFPWGIALDVASGKMYWADISGGDIRRANLDGSSPTTLVSGLNRPANIALDLPAGKMYWTDSPDVNGDLRQANLDGTGSVVLVSGLNTPFAIALVPEPFALPLLGGTIVALQLLRRRRPQNYI